MTFVTKRCVCVTQSGVLNLTGRVAVSADGQSLTISFPNKSFNVSASSLTKVVYVVWCWFYQHSSVTVSFQSENILFRRILPIIAHSNSTPQTHDQYLRKGGKVQDNNRQEQKKKNMEEKGQSEGDK